MDPLSLLRDCLANGKDVKVSDTQIIIDGHSFNKTQPTCFHKKNDGSPYDLQTVWFAHQNGTLSVAQYIAACRNNKLNFVAFLDRQVLLDYLNGKIDSSPQIFTDEATKGNESSNQEAPLKKKNNENDPSQMRSTSQTEEPIEEVASTVRIKENEIVHQDRTTILHSSHKSFNRVLEIVTDVGKKRENELRMEGRSSKSQKGYGNDTASGKRTIIPIIIVPGGQECVFSMLNARDFFEKEVFVSPEQKKKEGARREKRIIFDRKLGEKHARKYEIVDSVRELKKGDWDRVLAVIVSGKTWQFKGWKYKTPADIFTNVVGVHFHYDTQKLDERADVFKWNVTILQIAKDDKKRYLDTAALTQFWDYVDKFMRLSKPQLECSSEI